MMLYNRKNNIPLIAHICLGVFLESINAFEKANIAPNNVAKIINVFIEILFIFIT